VHVSFKLTFDNKQTNLRNSALVREEARLPAVSSSILFEIFPFIIVYGEDMIIQTTGKSLTQVSTLIYVIYSMKVRIYK